MEGVIILAEDGGLSAKYLAEVAINGDPQCNTSARLVRKPHSMHPVTIGMVGTGGVRNCVGHLPRKPVVHINGCNVRTASAGDPPHRACNVGTAYRWLQQHR